MTTAKPFDIPKREVWEAFKKVKANQGAAGVDGQSIADFEADLTNNLYKRGSQRVKKISTAAGRVNPPMATANATGSSMKVATAAAGSGVGMPSCAI